MGEFLQDKGPKYQSIKNIGNRDFPGGPVVKNLPCNAGDAGLIPGWDIVAFNSVINVILAFPR